jgi:hypothetical protein
MTRPVRTYGEEQPSLGAELDAATHVRNIRMADKGYTDVGSSTITLEEWKRRQCKST